MPRTTHHLDAGLGAGLAAAIAIVITSLAAPAAAQCEPEWRSLRGGVAGTWYGYGPLVAKFCEIDDGRGRALYAGGAFRSAGGKKADRVARWDGWGWSAAAEKWTSIADLVEFDDGSGPALYAATDIDGPCVARWNGSAWTVIGRTNGPIGFLAVMDAGSGPELYAAGRFTEVEGVRAFKLARWDGVDWRPLDDGVNGGGIYDMEVFDDGSGPALFVAGNIFGASGVSATGVVRWDGESWSAPVPRGVQETMDFIELAVFDDGSGPALYGSSFFCDGTGCPRGGGILRWDGSLWQQVGGTFAGWPHALEVIDDGSGPALFAGGRFTSIGGEPVAYLARWNGASWSSFQGGTDGPVFAITTFDEGAGPTVFIGGEFTRAGGVDVSGVAAFGCPRLRCPADCDDDGALDIFDFLCFQNLFAAGGPAADCDGSGSLEFLDFLCFQNAFAAGCP